MSTTPEVPLHAIGPKEEADRAYVPVPDSTINFADDRDTVEWIRENVLPLCTHARDDGIRIRQEWAEIRRMLLMQHDHNQNYRGMSNAYLPVYARSLETRVSHTASGLFPTDDYLDVESVHEFGSEEQGRIVKAWMKNQFETQMRFRATIKPFLRQLSNYGLSIGKVWYNKQSVRTGRSITSPIPGVGMDYDYDKHCEGARFKTRSVFSWYMWPPTVDDIKEATLVFEDLQVPKQYIMETGKAQKWVNIDQALEAPIPGNVDTDLSELQQDMHLSSNTAAGPGPGGDLAKWVFLTECYFNMPVPRRMYRQNEEPGSAVPVQCLLAGTVPVLVRRNPYWFQHAPYVIDRQNETPDSFYGTGMGRLGKSLQYLANDFMNQTNDNATYGLNPVIKVNPNVMVGTLEPIAPGRVWPMTDPNGVVFDRPPIEQMQYGMQMVAALQTAMNDLLGTPPIMQGSGARGSARTATGAQILQANTKTDLSDSIEDIELNVLVPLMYMVHSLGQQYMSDEMMLATAGGTIRVGPSDLAGRFMFRWLASSQGQNKQMRSQQALQLLQLATGPLLQVLMQQGAQINPIPLLRKIYSDGLGFRDFDEFVKPAPMPPPGMPGMPPGMGPPGMGGPPGMPPMPPGPPPSPTGAPEQVEGEGEAFGEVRGEADDMAAVMGGGYGGQG